MPEYVIDRSRADRKLAALDPFTLAYVEAAMWTLPEDEHGNTYDHLGLSAITWHVLRQAIADCRAFQRDNAALLEQAGSEAQNGHDFWLTRNHHGAGFWDRGYEREVGDQLTKAAHAYGEKDWSVYRGHVYDA